MHLLNVYPNPIKERFRPFRSSDNFIVTSNVNNSGLFCIEKCFPRWQMKGFTVLTPLAGGLILGKNPKKSKKCLLSNGDSKMENTKK